MPMALRTQLLLLVGGPLLLLMMIQSMVSYLISMHAANLVFDRWLLNAVHSVARDVMMEDGQPYFAADPVTLEVFQWDELDRVHFQIATADFAVVAGSTELPAVAGLEALRDGPIFQDIKVDGTKARAVSLLALADSENPAIVTVAETLLRHETMTSDLLRDVLISKALLLLAVLLLIGAAFDRGLRPLIRLSQELSQRSPQDRTLIDVGRVPGEVRGLVENTNQLLSRLDSAIASREQFIGNIAHQIRTPIAGMKLQAQLAQDDDPAGVQAALERISQAADHMAHVNSQLMKLARAEAAFGRGLRSAPIDLIALVRNCCSEIALRAQDRNIELLLELPSDPVHVDGELTLLAEMVGNLLENAVTYGNPGGHVWTRLSKTRNGVRLVIEDDGPGIAHENWPQIFERFFRPAGSSGDGCGLGLAIVREIALAHGATVELEERQGDSGARFVITFGTGHTRSPGRSRRNRQTGD